MRAVVIDTILRLLRGTAKPHFARGTALSPTYISELQQLQAAFAPDKSLSRLDDFGKLLITSAATVGALGAAFATTPIAEPAGRAALVLAVALLGVSLAFAVFSLAPRQIHAAPNSRDALNSALQNLYGYRVFWLRSAAGLFAAALFVAGVGPTLAFAAPFGPEFAWNYSVGDDGSFGAQAQVRRAPVGALVELAVYGAASSASPLAKTLSTVDGFGNATVALKLAAGPRQDLRLSMRWATREESIAIPK